MNERLIFAHQKSDRWFKWFLVTGGLFFLGHIVYAVAVGAL